MDVVQAICGAELAPPAQLPDKACCMDLRQLLEGRVQQQRVWTFGAAASSSVVPREPLPVIDGVVFHSCSAGHHHSAAAADGGCVFTWGANDMGQLGIGAGAPGAASPPDCDQPTAQPVAAHDVEAAGASSCLRVYRLRLPQPVAQVSCGGGHTLARLAGAGLMAWGDNRWGQCGSTPQLPGLAAQARVVAAPAPVPAFEGLQLADASAGGRHSVAVSADGTVYTWGDARFGRLGRGGQAEFQALAAVAGPLAGCHVLAVAAGSAHTLALSSNGAVWAWGYNGRRALGVPGDRDALAPVQVPGLPPCAAIAAAASSLVLSRAGDVYAWGDNPALLQAADGSCPRAPLPWLPAGGVARIACGSEQAAAVAADGRLFLWGSRDGLPPSLLLDGSSDGAAGPAAAALGTGGLIDGAEGPVDAACGLSSTVLLCRSSVHTPTDEQVQAGILAVLAAYLQPPMEAAAPETATACVPGAASAGPLRRRSGALQRRSSAGSRLAGIRGLPPSPALRGGGSSSGKGAASLRSSLASGSRRVRMLGQAAGVSASSRRVSTLSMLGGTLADAALLPSLLDGTAAAAVPSPGEAVGASCSSLAAPGASLHQLQLLCRHMGLLSSCVTHADVAAAFEQQQAQQAQDSSGLAARAATISCAALLELLLKLVQRAHAEARRQRGQLLAILGRSYCLRLLCTPQPQLPPQPLLPQRGQPSSRLPWLAQQVLQPPLLRPLLAPAAQQLLARAFLFAAHGGTSTDDLCLTLADACRLLAPGAPVSTPASGALYVPPVRMAAVLRQAGLVPPLLLQAAGELQQAAEAGLPGGERTALPGGTFCLPLRMAEGGRPWSSASGGSSLLQGIALLALPATAGSAKLSAVLAPPPAEAGAPGKRASRLSAVVSSERAAAAPAARLPGNRASGGALLGRRSQGSALAAPATRLLQADSPEQQAALLARLSAHAAGAALQGEDPSLDQLRQDFWVGQLLGQLLGSCTAPAAAACPWPEPGGSGAKGAAWLDAGAGAAAEPAGLTMSQFTEVVVACAALRSSELDAALQASAGQRGASAAARRSAGQRPALRPVTARRSAGRAVDWGQGAAAGQLLAGPLQPDQELVGCIDWALQQLAAWRSSTLAPWRRASASSGGHPSATAGPRRAPGAPAVSQDGADACGSSPAAAAAAGSLAGNANSSANSSPGVRALTVAYCRCSRLSPDGASFAPTLQDALAAARAAGLIAPQRLTMAQAAAAAAKAAAAAAATEGGAAGGAAAHGAALGLPQWLAVWRAWAAEAYPRAPSAAACLRLIADQHAEPMLRAGWEAGWEQRTAAAAAPSVRALLAARAAPLAQLFDRACGGDGGACVPPAGLPTEAGQLLLSFRGLVALLTDAGCLGPGGPVTLEGLEVTLRALDWAPQLSSSGAIPLCGLTRGQLPQLLALLACESAARQAAAQRLRDPRSCPSAAPPPEQQVAALLGPLLAALPSGAPVRGGGSNGGALDAEQAGAASSVFWRTELGGSAEEGIADDERDEQGAAGDVCCRLDQHADSQPACTAERLLALGERRWAGRPSSSKRRAAPLPGGRVAAVAAAGGQQQRGKAGKVKPQHKRGRLQPGYHKVLLWRAPNFSEPAYLGGGVFQASPAAAAVWRAMEGAVAARRAARVPAAIIPHLC